MNVIIIIATVTLMVFFNAFYVAAEFATVSARRTKISQLAGPGQSAGASFTALYRRQQIP